MTQDPNKEGPMKAFHNDLKIKQKYVNRVIAHRKADNIIRGTGWTGTKGCAVGCTLEKYDHKQYETELGIPEWLARVEDTLFEGMSYDKALTWPEEFLKAIKPGADLEKAKAPFLIYVLSSTLVTFDHERFPQVAESINSVIDLYSIGDATDEDFSEAARAARAAWAVRAAEAAAEAAAEEVRAAEAAAEAAEAAWAAWAAAEAARAAEAAAEAAEAAWAGAGEARCDMFADELLRILRGIKAERTGK